MFFEMLNRHIPFRSIPQFSFINHETCEYEKILFILGSLRAKSFNRKMANVAKIGTVVILVKII